MAVNSFSLLCSAVLLFALAISANAVPAPSDIRISTSANAQQSDLSSDARYTNQDLEFVRQSNDDDDDDDDDGDDDDKDDDKKDDDKKDDDKDDGNDKDDDDDDKDGDKKDSKNSTPGTVNKGSAGSDDVCFSGLTSVLLESGIRKLMSELAVGDRVQVGPNQFSEVFMFTHKMADVKHDFITLRTAAGPSISLTAAHYIHSNGGLVAAETVKVGDTVELGDGSMSAVAHITNARMTGLYNPQTIHGDIIVDGVRASTYTASVHPKAAHALLAPLRALFRRFAFVTKAGEYGGGSFVQYFPKGGIHEAL